MIFQRLLYSLLLLFFCGYEQQLVKITQDDIRLSIANDDTIYYSYGDTIRLDIRAINISEKEVHLPMNGQYFRLIERAYPDYIGEKFSIEGISIIDSLKVFILKPYEELIFQIHFAKFNRAMPSGKKEMGVLYHCEYRDDIEYVKFSIISENSVYINIRE